MSDQPKEKPEVACSPTGNGHVADEDVALVVKTVEYLSEASITKKKSPIQDRILDLAFKLN